MHTHKNSLTRAALRGIVAAFCLAGASAHAITVKVKVENVSQTDGLWFTPVFFGFHNGSFDTFDAGLTAPGPIEDIAEGGVVDGLVNDADAAGIKNHVLADDASEAGGPPVLFSPGESAYFTTTLDSLSNRYLSFASMLLPSNDAFFGNPNPTQYELFDVFGNFKHGFQIDLFGSDIWDAGTEQNDFLGAPLSSLMGTSTETMGSVQLLGQSGLNEFSGRGLAVGGNLSDSLYVDDQIARISVQQVPDSTQYIGFLGAFAIIGFRLLAKKRMGKEDA
ncbi:spondin domain-containing protein [Pelagicoccus mobilis]|uniref:Spondin domain-containing protein n=1 Tax=Pelagicoccus mobilis TaxID=415221 RepID=A0A934VS28_9BACT|nr:spondin domain-containing protein [Pelagicoccus mobilis]MBK1880012.1 spondin domain-containing protein [Pelagicoccus mobilis]